MAVVRLPIQQDFTAIPVLYAKYNVSIAKQFQASGIMPRNSTIRQLDYDAAFKEKVTVNQTNCGNYQRLYTILWFYALSTQLGCCPFISDRNQKGTDVFPKRTGPGRTEKTVASNSRGLLSRFLGFLFHR
jgi:hypothetical protein